MIKGRYACLLLTLGALLLVSCVLSLGFGPARVPAATGERAEVEIRGKWYPVRVVQANFVRHGKALI